LSYDGERWTRVAHSLTQFTCHHSSSDSATAGPWMSLPR
jgi:hypothetical protein